jgi:hypothetical protein
MNLPPQSRFWFRWLAALTVAGILAVGALVFLGVLKGASRNLLPQALAGGLLVLAALGLTLLRYFPETLPAPPVRGTLVLLILFSLLLMGVYLASMRALLRLPYDLASWSEPMFVVDIIKLRMGQPLYLPAGDGNSNVYTFLTPVVSYALAKVAGRPESIPFYRLLQQFYLFCAALLAASAALQLAGMTAPEKLRLGRRLWWCFFFLASFLFLTNDATGVFNIYLHNDPFSAAVSLLAFWAMVKHASCAAASGTESPAANRWLCVMAVLPAVGFLAKQYLAIWAAAYVLYLWIEGSSSLPRLLKFSAAAFGGVALAIGAGLAMWGGNFRYWVFQVMGATVISFARLSDRFADAGWHLVLGLLGGLILVLVRGANFPRLLGIFSAWFVLFAGAISTSGITFHPSHFGPCTEVGFCLFLAGLAVLWPEANPSPDLRALGWFRTLLLCLSVFLVFAGLHLTQGRPHPVQGDLFRYVQQIEKEFEDLPADRVLLDNGEWIYLKKNVLMKDRFPILVSERKREAYAPFLDRIRTRTYARILVHVLPDGRFSYDIGPGRGIGPEMLSNYREVRRIPRVVGMESWLYYTQSMSDVVVLEPLPQGGRPASPPAQSSAH